jgi:methyl-accepting chemotaxis protein
MMRSSSRFDRRRAAVVAVTAGILTASLALISGLLGYPLIEQAWMASSIVCAVLSLALLSRGETESESPELTVIERIISVCGEISKGNFEARITENTEDGVLGDVQHKVNDMIDRCDAFVREATASLQSVCQNIYYRRIMLGGMRGSFHVAAEIINNAVKMQERAVEKARHDADLEHAKVIGTIGQGLDNLKKGDLTFRLVDLPEAFAALKVNYNSAVHDLETALANVGHVAASVYGQSQEISSASDELSGRTERQSEMLGQSGSSIEELVDAVNKAADASTRTKDIIAAAKVNAVESMGVVQQSVQAMGRIKDSSERIGAIIGVIDEIAFQTNLLALNAGIEAARAGEAGRGFAVVASEVRNLAQRSADAAREIKGLIVQCTNDVANGVEHVGATGQAFENLRDQIGVIDGGIADIAGNAVAQSSTIKEINTAIGELDATTQQNAAMGEEVSASCRSLADESGQLTELLSKFVFRDVQTQAGASGEFGGFGEDRSTAGARAAGSAREAA